MLEVTNLRDGAVLNHHDGIETEDYLEIPVTGIADPQADITVNGVPAERCDRIFSSRVRLTGKFNRITIQSDSYYGIKTLTLTLVWDKKSSRRSTFFFDDVIFCMRSLAKNRPSSIFDELFLGRLKSINAKYGTKFTLNLFFADDHHKDFTLADMPEDYKAEFQANSSWLRFSFHARSEFPDRPYQNASKEKLAADYDEIYREVCRFAGAGCFIPPTVIHWGMTNPENFSVLKDRGVKLLAGGFLGLKTSLTESHSIQVTDIGYHYEKDVACYILKKHLFYDRFHDIFLYDSVTCCNLDPMDVLKQKFANLQNDTWDIINLASHEQYSYPDYFNYIPDHLDRIEFACKSASELGYTPVWFSECGCFM